MPHSAHTYGPTCCLTRNATFSGSKGDDDIPPMKPQYFYYSTHSVDDPLSAVPVPTGNETKPVQYPPQPFSPRDTNALEEAWLGIASDKDKKRHKNTYFGYGFRKHVNTKVQGDAGEGVKGFASSQPAGSPTSDTSEVSPNAPRTEWSKESKSSKLSRPPKKERGFSHNRGRAADILNPSQHSRGSQDPATSECDHDDHISLWQPRPTIRSDIRSHETASQAGPSCCGEIGIEHESSFEQLAQRDPSCCGQLDSKEQSSHGPISRKDTSFCGDINSEPSQTDNSSHLDSQNHAKNTETTKFGEEKLNHKRISSRQKFGQLLGNVADDGISQQVLKDLKKLGTREYDAFHGAEIKTGNAISSKAEPSLPIHIPESTPLSSDPVLANLPQVGDAGTTGLPFVKFPSQKGSPRSASSHSDHLEHGGNQNPGDEQRWNRRPLSRAYEHDSTKTGPAHEHKCKSHKNTKEPSDVPVGVSRLHLVELPTLLMKPIYWAHVHDTAPVIRGTWFYKDNMFPVEPAVANQLEMGYRELRPWSQTWSDELSSAMEVGAAGEEKIAHRLWPKDERSPHVGSKHLLSTDPQCAARCFRGEAAAEGTLNSNNPGEKSFCPRIVHKKYSNSQIIYSDTMNAFILKPNLQPSAYYGRKPLQKIRKGRSVGIHVVRGFDHNAWEKLHSSKESVSSTKTEVKVPISGDADSSTTNSCPACRSQEEAPNVTDLCLVIHGIGQKLSERVESFNFTHACNSVRRSVNVELGTEAVKKVLRPELGGIMVLPINWRSNLSFDDGGPIRDGDKDKNNSDFSLKDITPCTIPAVRNLISDVMLDIPFYMSHHKQKMVQAVICEANRVYRLWCKNNPNFHLNGRVHVIAHSLGSAMALEILSNQPTSVPKLDLRTKKINTKHFDFNTTNLFCAGSPCGFFLLLERGKLCPRRGQNKAGAEVGDDNDKSIVGEAGTFGCLAVDNIYNIMHCNDPITYRLNATVDLQYAASLKEAHVPSATTGFFEGIGNTMKSLTPGILAPVDLAVGQVAKPTSITRLPSQLEMEVHDFTREEIAEKKFYLLNDNCQIDWLLNSGGGPFEVAYFDMLGAHSSYWERKEFIRLLVTEVGRAPGRNCTLPNMRAVKIQQKM